ncbi:MAG: DUF5698 domain-containing protein [Anaerolineales bacterium]|jgi:uncharacterized protein YebE (UPF0316 family)
MENLLSINIWIGAAVIFTLRVVNIALDTLRIRMMARGQKPLAFIFGVIETLIFVYTLGSVFQDLDNWIYTLAYAFGFGTGSIVGMIIDERLAVGFIHLRVISPNRGALITSTLREKGFAVTEFSGRGRDGTVSMLSLSVQRKNVKKVRSLVEELDENAFITAEDLTPVRRGYWGI